MEGRCNLIFLTSEGFKMKKSTKLRLLGVMVLLINLIIIGAYNITGIPVILMTFGFAIAYEYIVVKPTIEK